MAVINPVNGSYKLYDQDGMAVTLTFPPGKRPEAGFTVETKAVPASGLPTGYTWIINFGIKNKGGQYLPTATYNLQGSSNKNWFVYYGDDPDPSKNVHAMNGTHENAPGDPPIGHG